MYNIKSNKLKNIDEYKIWLNTEFSITPVEIIRLKNKYNIVASLLKSKFEASPFWSIFLSELKNINDEYQINTGYDLLLSYEIKLLEKSWDSFFLKSYRKNIIDNPNFPQPPSTGWLLPSNWLSEIKDIVRTLILVKYLDGTEFVSKKLVEFAESQDMLIKPSFEARDHGYYAVHISIPFVLEVPTSNFDSEPVGMSIEIQISTQLQDVIRKLTHTIYEGKRIKPESTDVKDIAWQWRYKSEEFVPNYLGHILHYIEGMIMDIREKQRSKIK